MKKTTILMATALLVALLGGCGPQRKTRALRGQQMTASLQLPRQADYLPEYKDVRIPVRDTLRVTDLDGREMILMKAIRDESTGDMVAAEMLDAARTSRRRWG